MVRVHPGARRVRRDARGQRPRACRHRDDRARPRDDETLITDGPFAETKEILGGYYLIDVPDLDAALAWAAKMPNIMYGSVEVRPIWEIPEAPTQ